MFKEAGDNTVSWRSVTSFWCTSLSCALTWSQGRPFALHSFHSSAAVCNKIRLKSFWWPKGYVLFLDLELPGPSAMPCSCGALQPLGCCTGPCHWNSRSGWPPWPHYLPAHYQIKRISEILFSLYLCQDKFLQLIYFHLLFATVGWARFLRKQELQGVVRAEEKSTIQEGLTDWKGLALTCLNCPGERQ